MAIIYFNYFETLQGGMLLIFTITMQTIPE